MTVLINKGQSNTFALDNLDNKALTVGYSYVFEFINGQSKQSQKLTIVPVTVSNVSEFILVEGTDITFANKGSYEYILREDDSNELCRGKLKVVGVNSSKPSPTLNKTYVVYEQ